MSDQVSEARARTRLRLLYGMTDIRQDPDNGTWWVGSELRPDLLNLDTLADAVDYLDRLPDEMVARLFEPRGSDSEPQHQE